jgi:hypothetical protein
MNQRDGVLYLYMVDLSACVIDIIISATKSCVKYMQHFCHTFICIRVIHIDAHCANGGIV